MDESPGADRDALRALDPSSDMHAPLELRRRIERIPHRSLAMLADVRTSPLRISRLWTAAAAAAVVLALGAGALWISPASPFTARTTPLATTGPGEASAPITLSGTASANGAADTSTDVALGLRSRFTVPPFSATSARAHVYAVDTSKLGPTDASRIAGALGVVGEPQQERYGDQGWWRIAAPDNSSVSVSEGSGTFSYAGGRQDPVYACATNNGADPGVPDAYERCQAEVPLPTDAQVQDALARLLAAAGLGRDDVQVTITAAVPGGDRATTISAMRIIDHEATPIGFRARVSHEGILSADGQLGDFVDLGPYDIVSPAEASQRLNTTAFAPAWPANPYEGYREPNLAWPSTPAPAPTAGARVPWGISEHAIVSGRRGLGAVWSPNGAPLVVPAYAFTDSEGLTWSVIALTEHDLDIQAFSGMMY